MMVRKIQLGFVILQYKNYEDTLACVDSICNNTEGVEYHIVIVDNASPNGAGDIVKSKYANNSQVTVILNIENSGFSAGNNIGISYLRKEFVIEYLVVLNNDTLLLQQNLYAILCKNYQEAPFAVAGPMILTADGMYTSNPLYRDRYTKEDALQYIEILQLNLLKNAGGFSKVKASIYYRRNKRKQKNLDDYKIHDVTKYLSRIDNAVLHGSFLIFTEDFFHHFSGFAERTFMYGEELILHAQVTAKNLVLSYIPEIMIYHKEGKSVLLKNNNSQAQDRFVNENLIEAFVEYLKVLEEI